MTEQRHTIMGACNYSIATLQQLKKDLVDIAAPDHNTTWAIGSIIVTLVSHLLQDSSNVFIEAAQAKETNMREEILEIKARFDQFVEQMVNHE